MYKTSSTAAGFRCIYALSMRRPLRWVVFVLFAGGCSGGSFPSSPVAPTTAPTTTAVAGPLNRDSANWSPWSFWGWQPGLGDPLPLDALVDGTVVEGDQCVAHIRSTWDWRTSCTRFFVSVPLGGRLDAFLQWDTSAPGFDPSLSGDVVLVAPNGRFTASDWQHAEEHIFALVQPGEYGVVVMSYTPATLPFRIRATVSPE